VTAFYDQVCNITQSVTEMTNNKYFLRPYFFRQTASARKAILKAYKTHFGVVRQHD